MRIMLLSGSRADLAYLLPVAAALKEAGTDAWIESLQSAIDGDDTPQAIAERAGRIMIGGGKTIAEAKPDMLVVLGDRWEIASGCLAASLADVPIAHIGSGERTAGSYDDKFRGAIEGLATLRFSLCRTSQERSPGCILAGCTSVMAPKALSQGDGTAIVALYPETAGEPLAHLVNPIVTMCAERGLRPIIFGANSDVGSHAFKGASLPPDEFHYLLYHATVMVGNSSAAIIEAPILGTPAVNIGTRQDGRPKARSVFSCHATEAQIAKALDEALAFGKQRVVSEYENEEAVNIITREIVQWLRTSAQKGESTTVEATTRHSGSSSAQSEPVPTQ